jgi:uncharacterized protein
MRIHRQRFYIFCLAVAVTSSASAQSSLDCATTALPDEQAICSNADRARQNRDDERAFVLLALEHPEMVDSATAARNQFIAARRNCSADVDCIQREQDSILEALSKLTDSGAKPIDEATPRPVRAEAADVRAIVAADRSSQKEKSPSEADASGTLRLSVIAFVVLSATLGLIFFFRRQIRALLLRRHEQRVANRIWPDKRREPRKRTRLRSGKLFDLKGELLAECTICDRSYSGARVRVSKSVGPNCILRFQDEVDKTTVEARVAWRRANEIGLAFLTR